MMNYLKNDKIKLVRFEEKYITPKYFSWLNDQEVNKYLYVGRIPVTYGELRAPDINDHGIIMFAILSSVGCDSSGDLWQDKEYNYYIGTATIHHIDWINRRAEIGYMIGNKEYWNAGLATDIVSLINTYCFNRLNLNKIVAGVVEGNNGSIKVLEKNGFKQYAVEEQEFYLDGKYLNAYRFHNFKN